MNNLRYSIIYVVIRPEITEQLSVGLIIVDGERTDVRVSKNKLKVLESLFPAIEYRFISRVINSLRKSGSIDSVQAVDYLSRYSNNLITVSPLQSIDIEPTEKNKEWLYKNYVYKGRLA